MDEGGGQERKLSKNRFRTQNVGNFVNCRIGGSALITVHRAEWIFRVGYSQEDRMYMYSSRIA